MEFESGSELDPVDELRQIAGWWKSGAHELETLGEGWWVGWPRAKMAAMEAENEVQQSAVSWPEARARAEASASAEVRAWVEAKAKVRGWVSVQVDKQEAVMALLLGAAWGEARARARAQARGERVPDSLADPQTIANILTSFKQSGYARLLWDDSLNMRDEYWCIIQLITPITRLPIELLRQIFLPIIEESSSAPLVLTLVCEQWHSIITGIWRSLNLSTGTPKDFVTGKLERNQWLLDIVVDTDSDYDHYDPLYYDFSFEAVFAAIEASPRWRSFVVESLPAQAHLPEDLVNRHLQRHSNATMSRFTTFRIKSTCETSPLLNGLLHILGTTAGPALTTVEINSTNVISFLAPAYSSFFHSVKVLSLNAPGIHDPVDLLPHLHQLETFTVSYLSFPTYPNHIELPFVHTLRHLNLRAAPIQWMSDQTFHALEYCALILPQHQHVLHTFHTTLC